MFPTQNFERLVDFFTYFRYPQQLEIGLGVPKTSRKLKK